MTGLATRIAARVALLTGWAAAALALSACVTGTPTPLPPTSIATIYPTATPTEVPLPTAIPTSTPTPTPSSTPSPTPSPTPTASATPTPSVTVSPIVAVVDGTQVPRTELLAEIRRQTANAHAQVTGPANPTADPVQLRDLALKALIDDALVSGYAARSGITVTEDMVESEMSRAVSARGGAAAFQLWLRDTQLTQADVRTTARRGVLGRATRDFVLRGLPAQGDYVRLAHILIATEADAQTVLAQLRTGTDFAALAQAMSLDSTTRGAGGDLGWIASGSGGLAWPDIERAAAALEPGDIAGPVRTPIGFHVVKLLGRERRTYRVEDSARLAQRALERWVADLRANAAIAIIP